MVFDRQIPYNDLPDLPPEADLETTAVLKHCIGATRALAELKGVGDTTPNQALLIRSIGLQEARSSSEIENIVTTTDDLGTG
jgi:Fic family protein